MKRARLEVTMLAQWNFQKVRRLWGDNPINKRSRNVMKVADKGVKFNYATKLQNLLTTKSHTCCWKFWKPELRATKKPNPTFYCFTGKVIIKSELCKQKESMLDKHWPPLASALKHLATVAVPVVISFSTHSFIYTCQVIKTEKGRSERERKIALDKPSKSRLSAAMKWKRMNNSGLLNIALAVFLLIIIIRSRYMTMLPQHILAATQYWKTKESWIIKR